MAKSFNLTAQINLQGPANLKPVVNNIKKQLSGVTANVKLNIDPKASKNITNITQKLQAMNAVLIQARTNTNALNNSLTSLGSALNTAGKAGTVASNGVSKAASSAQSAAKSIKQAGTEMQEFGKQSALAIRRFAAFSVATGGIYGLINAVNSGVKAFINFDRELIKLQQVTGKGITGISSLEKEITKLATTLGVSSESLASVAITLAQAGLSAEETRVALVALAKTELAPSFDNITDTTEGAIAALRQFGLQASELEGVLSSINAVSKAFAVESKDIIAAIQRTGGVFASASKGVSEGSDALNEFIAIFTSVRQTTRESAETIATGLRTIFTRIQRQSTVEALDELGIKLRDVDGQFVGAYEAIRRLSEGLNRLDPRSREFAAISEELGGFRQIGKVIPLIQQFAVAQEALRVAQKGQGSLTEDQVTAQKSLANQLAKVREQFLALIREVGKSAVFQGFFKIVVSLSSALISLAGAFKPILPLLGILGAVKGASAIGQFATGFFGGLKKTGGAGAAGSNVASSVTGSASKSQQDALNQAATAIKSNTTAIQSLTGAINKLTPAVSGNSADIKANIDNVNTSVKNLNTALVNGVNALGKVIQNLGKGGGGTKGLNDGGKVLGFARGGVVPGSGNRDTVPAMLQPGEFVIRKKAVRSIGTDKLRDMNKYAIGGRVEDEIQGNMNVSRISDKKNIKAFGLAGLYAGSAKADSFGVSGQKNIKLFQGTSKEEDAVLYTSSLNTSIKGQGTEEIEKDLKQSYIKSVNKFAKALAGKIEGQASNVTDILDEQAFSVVSGNAFESAIRAIGAPFLEKTEKTKALDFPLGLGQAANLFGNIPSNIPADVTRTVGGKGKGEAAIVGQIERFLEAVTNKEFTKAKYGGTFPLQIAEAIENITAQALTADQIREKISQAQDPNKKSAVDRYLKVVGSKRGTQTRSLKTIYETKAKLQPDELPVVEEGILALENIVLGRASGGKAADKIKGYNSGGSVKLYHGSNSGADDAVLKSFQEKGILSNIASGYGQGSGFFMWSDKNSAIKHAKNLVDPNSNMTTSATTGGRPMVVEATETLDPKNWDLDYELQNKDIIDYIHANFDSLKPLLDKSQGVDLGDGLKNFQFRNKIDEYTDPNDNTTMRKVQIGFDDNGKEVRRTLANTTGDLRTGQVVGKLVKALRMGDPDVLDAFENNFFSNLQAGTALKYVGSSPLMPSNIETFALGGRAGLSTEDTVPALLTPGEFVVNKKSAQKIGYGRLNKLNQADKIKGYNKGGIVSGIQTFLGGGRVDQDAVRAQGTVLTSIKEAEKTFAMVMGSVSKDVRDSILSTFKGIEAVAAGGKTSMGTKFGNTTRGQAVFGTSGGKNVSMMGLQLQGKQAQATTETVGHEAGHLADAAMTNFKGFASQQKGTFQFEVVEKIKPTMEAAFKKAGESSNFIANYLTRNEELFAEFFAKASPEIKKILTSTTDAAKGMEELKKHLEKAGETYAGLSAADIIIPSGMPPIPPAPPPTVPPTPLPPGPGGPGRDRFNFANENDREFFSYRAKQAGKSVGSYRTDAARKIAVEQRNIFENQRGKREETRRGFQGQSSETGQNLRELAGAAKSGSAADTKKYRDALKAAMQDATAKLKEISPSLSPKELKSASKELVRAMINGESINDAIAKSGSALEKAFNDNITSSKALDMAIEKTAKELDISADQLRGNLSRKDIARQQFIGSETGQKFGRAAQFAPDALRRFSQTGTGQATLKAADFLSGKGLTGKLEKSLGNAGKFIGDKIEALGGPMVVLGSTVAMAADQINKAFDGIKDPTTAGVVGGIGGAGSGLASGALLGAQIAGPVGAMIGGISGAIIGGIDGAFKAFNEARLAKNLKDLEKSAEGAAIALKEFETNQTNESARALLDATMSGQDAIRDLAQTAQIQYGEPSWARAIVNGLSNLPVISNIMGTAQRGESVQALDQRAAMVLGNFERFGQRQLSRAPTDQVEDVIRRANEAADAAGTDDTEAGRDARAAARRGVYAQANQTYQTMAREGYTDNDIFEAMGRQSLQQQGIDPATKSQEEVRDAGKAAAAASAEAAFKQQQMANAIRETNRSVESLLDIFRVATAGLDRFNYELGLIATKAEDTAAALSGNATLGPVDRSNEQVLSNISAYSMDEVKAVAANIGSLAGGEGGEKLQNQVVAAKVLQDELPKILRNTSSEGVEDVTSQLRDVFKNLSIEAPEGLFTNIAKTLEEKTEGREGVSLADLADDTDFLGTASKVSAEALALAAKYANAFNNAMQQATDQANQYAKSLDEATQWQLRAADIRARADIQLAETLGKTLSLAEQAAPFENRIRGLSGGVIAGGSVDPNDIYQAMISATEDRKSMQEELAARQQTLQVNPEDKNAQKAVADQTRLIAEQNNKINNANKALEELANDSSRAADALNKLNELNKVAAGSVNFLQKALTSDSKSLIQMNKQLQDYTKFVSGQATTGDVNNLQFRQNVFAGLEDISSMMPASLAQQMQAKVARGMIESMPGGQALLQQTTGAIGPDGEKITFDSALNMMEQGKDPAQERYIQAYEAATQAQANAADRLGEAALLVAETFNNSLQDTIAAVGALPATMREAMGQANAPPGGENKPDDKDQTVQLVMDDAELQRIRDAIASAPTLGFDTETAGTLDTTMKDLIVGVSSAGGLAVALYYLAKVIMGSAIAKGAGQLLGNAGGLGRIFGGGGGAASGNPFSGMSGTMGRAAVGGTDVAGTSGNLLGRLGRVAGGAEVLRGGIVGGTENTPTNQAVKDVVGEEAGTAVNTLTGALTGNTGRAFVSDLLGFETNSVGDQLGGTLEAAGRGAAIGYQYGGGQGAVLGAIAGLTGDMLKNIILLVGEVGKLRAAQADAAAQEAKARRIEENLQKAELERSKASGVDTSAYDALSTSSQIQVRGVANSLLQREKLDERLVAQGATRGADGKVSREETIKYAQRLTDKDLQYITGASFSNASIEDKERVVNETRQAQTSVMPEFQTALDQVLARGRAELQARNAEDAAAQAIEQQRPDIEAMGQMAANATKKGSIFTHDIHLESLLKDLLGQQPDNEKLSTTSSASELVKNLPNLTKGLSGSIGATSLDFRKNAFAELDFIKNIIPEDLFSQVSSQMSGFMIKSLPDSSKILKSVMGFADGKEMTLESILGGSGGDFIGSIQSLIGEKSSNVLDLVNNLLPQQFKDLFNIFDKPEQTTNESCECKILKEILATLKGQSTPAQINKQAAVAATAVAEKTVTSKPTGIGTLNGGVAADNEKIVKGTVIQAPKAPGTEKSTNNSVASMLASGGFGTMTLPKSQDSPAKLKAILESKRNKYAAAGSKLSKNQITKEEYDKIKGEYKESRGRYGFATSNQIASPYQQQQSNRREAYLATKNPAVTEKLMTNAEKQKRDLLEKQKREELEKQKAQPVPSALPTIRGGGSLDGGVAGDRAAIGSGPTGQSLGTVITVDQSATNLLEGLKTTFNSFNSYIDKLATVASTIPNEINLVGSYDLNVNITGAAAFENLSKEMQSVAEAIIRPKLEQLRDEISQATKGAVKSSASMGYRGDVNPTSAQGMA